MESKCSCLSVGGFSLTNVFRTPLHFAVARSSDHNVSRQLIKRGADIGSRNIGGKTPFHTFFRETNRELLACYSTMLETTITDDRGLQLLHYVAWSSKSIIADIQPFLTRDIACISAKDNQGRSVLFFLAERGNIAILDYILNLPKRPNVNDTDTDKMSLMHYAVRSKRVQTINILYKYGCSTQAIDNNKQTALHHAVKRKNLEAAKRLLQLDGKGLLGRVDSRGRSPLDIALSIKEIGMITYLRSMSSSISDGTVENSDELELDKSLQDISTLHSVKISWLNQVISRSGFWRVLFIFILIAILLR